ncbi:hypothetical protein F4774DRAFT_89740 [Daldinia eschscholtzii]|nr:hypothetical protein F4774DRAFT_89740 [Daldinia eschscholtzii]
MADSILELLLANPEQLKVPGNVAEMDALAQIGAAKGECPSPLLFSAIEHKDASIDLIHDILRVYERERLKLEYAYREENGPWIRESPLVTAVRAGRPDVVEMLIKDYLKLVAWMKFIKEDKEFEGEPCMNRHCMTAVDYAVDMFRIEKDAVVRQKIEDCAIVLVVYVLFPGPLKPEAPFRDGLRFEENAELPRFFLTASFASAIDSGMDRYVTARVRRILEFPSRSFDHRALVMYGLEDIFCMAAKSGKLPGFFQYMAELAYTTDGRILPLPDEPEFAANPIALALTSEARSRDAIQILQTLKLPIFYRINRKRGSWRKYVVSLLTHASIVNEAAKGECFDYFVEHMKYIHTFLLESPDLPQELVEPLIQHRDALVQGTLLAGKSSLRNFSWAVVNTNGYDNREWLHRAIVCGNAGAVEVIVSRWIERRQSLETQLPPVDPMLGYSGCERSRTGLSDAVQLRHLAVIVVLLNAGANPNSVYPEEWAAFLKEVATNWQTMSRFEFMKLYFRYGFFEGQTALVSEEEMANNGMIENYVRLILRVGEQHYVPKRLAI